MWNGENTETICMRERGYVHMWNGENTETICIRWEREKERLCPYVKWWKHWNYLCKMREKERRERERGGYVHMWNSFLIRDTPSTQYCTFLWMAWLRWSRSAKFKLILTTRWWGCRSASRSRGRSAKFELILMTRCQYKGVGVDLPNFNSSWPLDVSIGG